MALVFRALAVSTSVKGKVSFPAPGSGTLLGPVTKVEVLSAGFVLSGPEQVYCEDSCICLEEAWARPPG